MLPHQSIFRLYHSYFTFLFKTVTAVVPDDEEFFWRWASPAALPQDRPTSPGTDLDPESDPQLQPRAPVPARRRAVAHVRLISIAESMRI